MSLQAAILAAMMTLPCPVDEPKAECAPWRAVVAEAIAAASSEVACEGAPDGCKPLWNGKPDELAAVLLEIAFHESGLRKRIQEGRCRPYECDAIRGPHGETVGFRARSMWQMHKSPYTPGVERPVPKATWLAMVGSEPAAVKLAAKTAAKVLVANPSAFGVSLSSPGRRGQAAAKLLAKMRATR